MLDVHFVLLGALASATGQVAYVRDTLQGRSSPNRVTFTLWAAAPLLAFAVELDAGVGLRSLMTFMVGAGPLAVLIASFISNSASWRITWFDLTCGGLSVAGTVGWLLTRQSLVGLGAAIAADALAGVPTVVKSWRRPDTETAAGYAGAVVNALITLLTLTRFVAAEALFPAYIFAFASVQLLLVGAHLGPRVRTRRAAVSAPP